MNEKIFHELCRSKTCGVLCLILICLAGYPHRADASSFDHGLLTEILHVYVDEEGWVDYQGLKDKGTEKLEAYVRRLENADTSEMSEKEKMAFFINVYNAFTLKLIVDHYPLDSIRKIPGLSGIAGNGQWKKDLWTLNKRKISLDAIEHEILRPMGDPRIHFALVCAARSCPPLARKAYTPETLDVLLEEQGRRFNQSPRGLWTTVEKGFLGSKPVLNLSSIYKWFKEDFLRASDNLPDFVQPYTGSGEQAFFETYKGRLTIRYMDYDWSLNVQ